MKKNISKIIMFCLTSGCIFLFSCSNSSESADSSNIPGSVTTQGCRVENCTPGDVEECEVDGVPGISQCSSDCQWNPCQPWDLSKSTDSENYGEEEEEKVFIPPPEKCPPGTFELNIRDIWSNKAPVHLNARNPGDGLPFDNPPNTLLLAQQNDFQVSYGAILSIENCDYFRTCLPVEWNSVYIEPTNPATECSMNTARSSPIILPSVPEGGVLTMSYQGTNADLTFDYFEVGFGGNTYRNGFTFEYERPEILSEYDPFNYRPSCNDLSDYVVLHIRWPWGDPAKTGFPGTACEQMQAGLTTPPYPSTINVRLGSDENPYCGSGSLAVLERWDSLCPWYRVLIPKSQWGEGSISFRYQDTMLLINPTDLPNTDAEELWMVYEGATDNENTQGTPCMNFSFRDGTYHFYTSNPGPGYAGCGGAPAAEDCSDIAPLGKQVVYFRYLWAGQKTFTYFPSEELMPSSIVLHVNGTEYFCVQEASSPWFKCPIPDKEFFEGSMWRAADKSNPIEWNTVAQKPTFPSTPGTYWMRWHYGKPDIPEESDYEVTDYYPDAVGWAQTGSWDKGLCFTGENINRPPITSDGYFPWSVTNYAYGFGQSIAKWYDNPSLMQNLLNYFVWDRYLMWKDKYVKEGDEACGPGTARVDSSDSVSPTVSEGQGYGMAIAAAIGDKETFDKLWRFVNHYLGQYSGKYCGGLMGWDWKGPQDCQPYGSNAPSGGATDSAFDGDVDIAIGLMYAAWQWPEYTLDAVDWLLKMECQINTRYDRTWYYPTPGDTWNKDCGNYPGSPCYYEDGFDGDVNMSYYPPGYFRVFGEFLAANLPRTEYNMSERLNHLDFWYKTAETVWEMVERCYDADIHPALLTDFGTYSQPCGRQTDNYNWSRGLWRLAVDAAWYGHDDSFYSVAPGSSRGYPGKSQMQAKMDLIQNFYAIEFPARNPGEPTANRFSTICRALDPSGDVSDCDPAYDHNSYFVTTAMSSFVTFFNNDEKTTVEMRKEALEESVSVAIQDSKYYQESLGVYQLLFLTGNFPRPYARIDNTPVIIIK